MWPALVSPVSKERFWFPAENLIFKEGSLFILFLVNPHPMIFFPLIFRKSGGRDGRIEKETYM